MMLIVKTYPPGRTNSTSNSTSDSGDVAFSVISGVLLLVGGLLIGVLFMQWFTTYFVIWGSPVVTESGIQNYEVTASACLLLLVGACVLAIAGRNRPLAWATGIFLVVGLVAALIFAIPQGRWEAHSEPKPLPSDYQPCFSGSNDCPGG